MRHVQVRLTDSEYAALAHTAIDLGVTLQFFCADALLRAVNYKANSPAPVVNISDQSVSQAQAEAVAEKEERIPKL